MTDQTVKTRDADEFYLVWRKGGANPRVSFQNYEKALAYATELAAQFPGKRWFVLKAKTRLWVDEAEDRGSGTDD